MRAGTRFVSTVCAEACRTEPEPSGGRNRTARRNSKRVNGLPCGTAGAATEPRRAPTEPGRGGGVLKSWEPGDLASCRSDGGVVRTPVFQVSSFPDPQTAQCPLRASAARAVSRLSISQNGQDQPSSIACQRQRNRPLGDRRCDAAGGYLLLWDLSSLGGREHCRLARLRLLSNGHGSRTLVRHLGARQSL